MLSKFVRFFAGRPALTVTLWLALVTFGVVSYTSLSPREGFLASMCLSACRLAHILSTTLNR